jgi:NitT/TauT family transport system substrate-binding protein
VRRTSRRDFLGGFAGSAAAALVPSTSPSAAEPRLETTTVRMIETREVCSGTPLVIAEDLLKAEGFTVVTHVGLDSRRDIRWVDRPAAEAMQMFTKGDIDAFMGFPPEPQELRARRVGHVVVNTTTDKPWSQYFCCVVMAHRDFVRRYPLATKRALRAIMKATTVCGVQPERAAQARSDKGYTVGHEYALQAIKELPYARWRDYNPEDTVRFYALRLHEAGLIKSSPQKIIAQGTDWRFFNELKKELKG